MPSGLFGFRAQGFILRFCLLQLAQDNAIPCSSVIRSTFKVYSGVWCFTVYGVVGFEGLGSTAFACYRAWCLSNRMDYTYSESEFQGEESGKLL